MQFSITRTNLHKGLNLVSRLASARMPLPILNNILLSSQPGQLVLSVTDLELGISTKLPARIDKEGSFTVPARLIHEFTQTITDETLEGIVVNNASLNLKGEHVDLKIQGMDASEFPSLPFIEEKPTFSFMAHQFKEAIDRVNYAAAIDDTRPVLAGIAVIIQDKEVILVATDSYRLAERRLKLANTAAKNCSVIVPKRTLSELSRLIADEPGDISVFVGDNQIQFEFGQTKVVSRLIEGNYPPYQSIIPNGYQTRVTAPLNDFMAALKTAYLLARESGNLINLTIVAGKGVTVESVANQRGEITNQFTAITEGDDLTIAFNVKYFLEALAVLDADNIFLEFSGAEKPAVIRPANSKEYLSLVMPLKLD
jgi:DNA polymerase III subunit beta